MKKEMLLIAVLVFMLVSVSMLTSCSNENSNSTAKNATVAQNGTERAPVEKVKSENDLLIEELVSEIGYQGVFIHTDNCGRNSHYTETVYRKMGGEAMFINILCKNFAVIFRSDNYHPYRGTDLAFIPMHNNAPDYNDRKIINVDEFFTVTDYQGPDGKTYYILRPRDINKFAKADAGIYTFQPFAAGGAWSFFFPLFGVIQ